MSTSPPRTKSIFKIFVILAAVLVITGWLVETPPGLFGKADAIGYAVCHRIDERSLQIGTRQLPLCARCTGMYLGAVTGIVFQMVIGRKRCKLPHWSVIAALGALTVAFGVDGANSYLYLIKSVSPGALANIPNIYVPNNLLRILTGSGMGLAMALMLLPAFNQTVWADAEDKTSFPSLKPFALLLGITLALDLLTLTESPIVLYPAAFISTVGVLALLTMVYTMVWVMLMRQDNAFTSYSQMWLPLLAGLTIALIQIAGIDTLRFWLTGTWGAFPLAGK
ncbi:MAG: hypothetical protein FD146_7 [Anaerolineaceae bacterium]|nr:MAG: hypothetical protein FD146_7 [Anaerolineaceae bacterium]